jgi:hypothetical protein
MMLILAGALQKKVCRIICKVHKPTERAIECYSNAACKKWNGEYGTDQTGKPLQIWVVYWYNGNEIELWSGIMIERYSEILK